MASEKPSAWAMADAKRAAERVVAAIEAECHKHGGLAPAYSVRLATPIIAAALEAVLPSAARSILANRQAEIDAARNEGRHEMHAEVKAWADNALAVVAAAEKQNVRAARQEGRRERDAEIAAWLRREASILLGEKGTPLSAAWAAAHQQAAEGIENGAVPSAD